MPLSLKLGFKILLLFSILAIVKVGAGAGSKEDRGGGGPLVSRRLSEKEQVSASLCLHALLTAGTIQRGKPGPRRSPGKYTKVYIGVKERVRSLTISNSRRSKTIRQGQNQSSDRLQPEIPYSQRAHFKAEGAANIPKGRTERVHS